VAVVNPCGALSAITPNVFIEKITLEAGGGILHEEYLDRVAIHTDPTPRPQSQKVQADSSVDYPDSELKIKIDLVLKETLSSLGEFWADKEDFQEYTNLLIFFHI